MDNISMCVSECFECCSLHRGVFCTWGVVLLLTAPQLWDRQKRYFPHGNMSLHSLLLLCKCQVAFIEPAFRDGEILQREVICQNFLHWSRSWAKPQGVPAWTKKLNLAYDTVCPKVSRQVLNCSMTQCTCEMMITTSAFVRNLAVVGIWGRLWGWARDLHVLAPEAAPPCSWFVELLPEVPSLRGARQCLWLALQLLLCQHTWACTWDQLALLGLDKQPNITQSFLCLVAKWDSLHQDGMISWFHVFPCRGQGNSILQTPLVHVLIFVLHTLLWIVDVASRGWSHCFVPSSSPQLCWVLGQPLEQHPELCSSSVAVQGWVWEPSLLFLLLLSQSPCSGACNLLALVFPSVLIGL